MEEEVTAVVLVLLVPVLHLPLLTLEAVVGEGEGVLLLQLQLQHLDIIHGHLLEVVPAPVLLPVLVLQQPLPLQPVIPEH